MNNDECDALEGLKGLVAVSDWVGSYEVLKSPRIQMLLDHEEWKDFSKEVLYGVKSYVKADFEGDFRAIWSFEEKLHGGVELAKYSLAMRDVLVSLGAQGDLTMRLAQTAIAIVDWPDFEPAETALKAFKAMQSEALYAGELSSQRLYAQKALSTARIVLGDDHPELFQLVVMSGLVEEWSGHSDRAIKYYEEALELSAKTSNEIGRRNRFNALQLLGAQLSETDRIDEAEKYLREAVSIWESLPADGSSPSPYLKALNSLACLLSIQRCRPHDARILFEKITHHQDLAVLDTELELPAILYNYGQCLLDLESHEDARRYLEWSRAILENNTDCDIDLLVSVLNGIALSYLEVDEYDSAIEYFRSSVDYSKRLGSKLNPTPARNLAVCLDRAGRPEEARPIYERLLSELKGLEDFERDRALILFDLAKNLGGAGEREGCIATFNQAIEATILVDGEASGQLAEVCQSLATYYAYEVFDYNSAADFMRKAVHIYEKLYGLSDERTIDARSELSEFLSGLGHVREARTYQSEVSDVGESEDSYDGVLSTSPLNPSPGGLPKRKPRRVLN